MFFKKTVINECQNKNYDCQRSTCSYTNGSYSCVCENGFTGSDRCTGEKICIVYHNKEQMPLLIEEKIEIA